MIGFMRSKIEFLKRLTALLVGLLLSLAPRLAAADPPPRSGSLLAAMEAEVRALVASVAPSVVTIRSACRTAGGHSRAASSSLSIGSGIILDSLGRILTSTRVIEDADDYWVETSDERIFPAALVGTGGEVAVLEINATNLKPAQLLENADLEVGSFVAAVGNSYGYAGGLTWGEVNGFRPDGTIQLSLGVPAGSSGGALVDTRGRVVGMVKAKISEPFYLEAPSVAGDAKGPAASGRRLELPTSSVSLAIPIATALRTVERLIGGGASAAGYIGVYVQDLTAWQAAHFRIDQGALVIGVVPGSPAQTYGLLPGDVIMNVGGIRVTSERRFKQMIAESRPGDRVTLDLLRGGQALKLTLVAAKVEWPALDDGAPTASTTPPGDFSDAETPERHDVVEADPRAERAALKNMPLLPASASLSPNPVEARLQLLEHALDSLQQEVQKLRKSGRP